LHNPCEATALPRLSEVFFFGFVADSDQLHHIADPYPYAVDETFDAYQVLVDTAGAAIGMSGHSLEIIASGDSA